MKNIVFITEKTKTGFSAYAQDYAIATTGESMTELKSNIEEATKLYFEDNIAFEIEIIPDFTQILKYYDVISSKGFAREIGMNPTLLSQYIGKARQLSPKQRDKIKLGFKKISADLQALSLLP